LPWAKVGRATEIGLARDFAAIDFEIGNGRFRLAPGTFARVD
jgi:hypothetical protein